VAVPDIIREVVATVRSLPLLGTAYDAPVDQVYGPWPAIVAYPEGGTVRLATTHTAHARPGTWGVHTISIRIHWPRKDLEFDTERILGFADAIPAALMARFIRDRFGGTVVALGDARSPGASGAIRYEFGDGNYGGVDTLAFGFSFDVTTEYAVEEAIP
jgi:hypothetical protein